MASKLQIQGDESVFLRASHSNIKSFSTDIRFSLQLTIEAIKEKLWRKCGTSVEAMKLELYDDSGAKVSDLSDHTRTLGFYIPQDGFRVHIIDLDPSSVTSCGWLEDTSLVEKYKISDEAYGKLDGTFRKFKEKFQNQNPNPQNKLLVDKRWEIDARSNQGRKGESSNSLEQRNGSHLVSGSEFSMMSLWENMMAW